MVHLEGYPVTKYNNKIFYLNAPTGSNGDHIAVSNRLECDVRYFSLA